MYKWIIPGMLAACALAAAAPARAGSDDATVLEAVKLLASKGQDPATAAQVSQYVDQNQNVISAILNGYAGYLKQIQTMANDNGQQTTAAPQTGQAPQNVNGGSATQGEERPSSALTVTDVQPSSGLVITGVQASGGLQTSHLAGYPALPDVEPVSSVTNPTAAQQAYAAKTQKEMQERKAYLMAHPEGYTY